MIFLYFGMIIDFKDQIPLWKYLKRLFFKDVEDQDCLPLGVMLQSCFVKSVYHLGNKKLVCRFWIYYTN
jgi:hypothetical protein